VTDAPTIAPAPPLAPTRACAPPFAHTSGPKAAPVVFVGEAWGEAEELTGLPFMGNAGQLFNELLREAGFARREVLLTNVFAARPRALSTDPLVKTVGDNNLAHWCASAKEVTAGYHAIGPLWGSGVIVAPLRQGVYIRPEFLPEVERLRAEILEHPRNLVVALGGTALWALAGTGAIGALRGTVAESKLCPGTKILATYHPSYLFKVWDHRPVVLADLMKAHREAQFPEIRRPERTLLVNPTLREIEAFHDEHCVGAAAIAVDVETGFRQIKCIGFAPARDRALVIPFTNAAAPGHSYWESAEDELAAWNWVEAILQTDAIKVFQNGLYDLQYILPMCPQPRNVSADTMLLHHALYPELQKGLGFLGSIYSNEPAWKLMRRNRKDEAEKRDE
jgi:uracil-DNA glycosylase